MKKTLIFLLCTLLSLNCLTGCSNNRLRAGDPVTLSIWHVYGVQTESPFHDVIDRFNRTVGREKGIIIRVAAVSSSAAIDTALTDAAAEKPGAPLLPDLFTAYPRVAEKVGTDRLLNWAESFSGEELEEFIPEFLEEGYFDDQLLMLPIAKSSEVYFLNQTVYDRFTEECRLSPEPPRTVEDILELCKIYYDWSGGMDFFQINDFYHYFLTGMAAQGEELIENGRVRTDSEAFRTIYEPMAQAAVLGGISLENGYPSDPWKTGELISTVSSTASVMYLRDYLTYADNSTENITTSVLPYPIFAGKQAVAVHRGGGLFAVRSEDVRKNKAAAVFAKWLTEQENQLDFVTRTGYLPVTKAAFDALFSHMEQVKQPKYRAVYQAIEQMLQDDYTFISIPLYENASVRQNQFELTIRTALQTAHNSYQRRLAKGEIPQALLQELVETAYLEIRQVM